MHPKAYAIVEKESGKIVAVYMTRQKARQPMDGLKPPPFLYRIIPVEIRKLKK